jgi:para-nitrobenzyl esterase
MFVLSAVMAATLITGTPAAGQDGLVWTDAGPVRGTVSEGYQTYQSIPFAAPPVGELRWQSPRPAQPWTQVRDATQPSPMCAQSFGGGFPSDNEDCLYLNVTTPSRYGRKPVLVWLHGGGNSYLAASLFDAKRLATQGDAVVVTTNFRLGAFGFLGHPGLPGSGAYGLEDQQAALRWVQRNAAAFGGDPRNVTLIGESGGAHDVCAQLTSPGARGLFRKAIAHSGGCSMKWPNNGAIHGLPASSPWISRSRAEADGVALAASFGCSDVACLRQVPASAFVAVDRGPTPVVYGNRVLPDHPAEALADGRFHRVPVIWGNTRDEGRLTAAAVAPLSEAGYRDLLVQAFGDNAARIAAEYPSSKFESPEIAYSAVLTDHVWACPQLTDDRLMARHTQVYAFEFADRNAPKGFFSEQFPPGFPAGAFHSSDVAYLFDIPGFDFTHAQQRLATRMIKDWTRFALTGDPGWPKFRDGNVQSLASGDIKQVNGLRVHDCGFWLR